MPDNRCPPKLVILDLNAGGTQIDSFTFPDAIVPHDTCFLNDIAVDVDRQVAYISDAGIQGFGTVQGRGSIVTFERTSRRTARFADATTAADPEAPINGTDVNGISLTPDRTRVFYCPLQ